MISTIFKMKMEMSHQSCLTLFRSSAPRRWRRLVCLEVFRCCFLLVSASEAPPSVVFYLVFFRECETPAPCCVFYFLEFSLILNNLYDDR